MQKLNAISHVPSASQAMQSQSTVVANDIVVDFINGTRRAFTKTTIEDIKRLDKAKADLTKLINEMVNQEAKSTDRYSVINSKDKIINRIIDRAQTISGYFKMNGQDNDQNRSRYDKFSNELLQTAKNHLDLWSGTRTTTRAAFPFVVSQKQREAADEIFKYLPKDVPLPPEFRN